LLAAAALARAPRARLARPGLAVAMVAALAPVGAAATVLLAWGAGSQGVTLVLVPWSASAFPTSVSLVAVPLTAGMLALVAGLGALAAARAWQLGDAEHAAAPLMVAAGACLFVLGAANPLGLVLGWVVLDVVLFVFTGRSRAGLIAGQVGLLMAVAAAITVPWPPAAALGPGPEGLPFAGLTAAGRFWLLSAGAVRMGLYPLWWAVPPGDRDRPYTALGTRLAPMVAGGTIVLLVAGLTPLGEGLTAPALMPTLVSISGAAALSWLASSRSESLDWQSAAQGALLVMAAMIGGPVGQAVGVLLLADLAITRAGLLLCAGHQSTRPTRAALWVLAAAAAALPPGLAFAGRWLLYRELLFAGLGGAVLAIVVATTLTTSALWDGLRLRAPAPRDGRGLAATVAALAAVHVLLGPALPWLGGVLAAMAGTTLPSPLAELWFGLGNRATLANTVVLSVAVLVPALAAALMGRNPRALGDARRRGARRALRLGGLATVIGAALVRAGAALHLTSGLLESRRAMAWTVAAAAITGAAMVVSPLDPTRAPPPATVLGGAVFVVAAVIGAVMVLGRAPGLTLGALAAGHAYAAIVLWLVAVPIPVAAMALVGGLLATAILAIGVLQAPIDRRLPGAALRLARAGAPVAGEGRGLPAVALAVGLLVSYGMQSAALPEAMPAAVVRPAFALATAGVLAAVFARSPLRLAAGVLMALTGFQIAYARLDPGLLVTAGLAVFQLLFAVVASYYVGTPDEDPLDQEDPSA